jgi:transposase
MPCHRLGWLSSEAAAHRISASAWLETGTRIKPTSGLPAVALHVGSFWRRSSVFIIGIDPHKGSHHAAVLNGSEVVIDELRVRADRTQRDRLLAFAACFAPRTWAVEGANGTGALLAQQLVAAGEVVLDIPPKLSARVRLLDTECADKSDSHDARSAAIVALRHPRLRVVGREDHTAVLRLLAKRHHDLVALRTQAICRLHALLCALVAGGLPRRLSAQRAARELRRIRVGDAASGQRRQIAVQLLGEVRRLDAELIALKTQISDAVTAADTTVTELYGVGEIVAAYLIGYTGDIARFPSAGHYARYNATAPIEASSGPRPRHRLNPKGNRMLNHAVHMAAVTQIASDTDGRAYYLRKQLEGKTRKEAMRALKRRISDAVYRQLVCDAER